MTASPFVGTDWSKRQEIPEGMPLIELVRNVCFRGLDDRRINLNRVLAYGQAKALKNALRPAGKEPMKWVHQYEYMYSIYA